MKKALIALATLATLASCSKLEMEPPTQVVPDPAAPILLSAGIEANTTVESRAAVVGTNFPANTSDVFRLTTYVGATASITNYQTTYFANLQVNSGAASALSFDTPQYYPVDGERKLYFYAYAPAPKTLTTASSLSAPIASYTLTGEEDIMAAQVTTGIAKVSADKVQPQPNFNFKHKLKQVQFKVKKDVSFEDNINVTSIKVKGVKTSAKLNIITGDLSFDAPTTDVTTYSHATGITISTTESAILGNSIMFQPGTTFNVDVVAGGITYSDIAVTLTGTNAGAAGVSHTVTLTFKRGSVTPTTTIGVWQFTYVDAPSQILPPAKMIYGGENGTNVGVGAGVAYALSGSTRSSYNDFIGLVSTAANGAYYTKTTVLYPAEKVYHNLEVALADEVLNGSTLMTWDEARTACGTKTTYGGGWRLPRFPELQLMYLNRESLQKVPGFVAFGDDGYYSKTEYNNYQVWIKLFNAGTNSSSNSLTEHTSGGQRARCVREVPAAPAKMYYGDAKNNGGITTITVGNVTYILKGSTTASYNNYPTGDLFDPYTDALIAEKGYHKLEVANAYELEPATGKNSMPWDVALKRCKAKDTDGGGWRMPHLSELYLIYMNKTSLEQTPEFEAFHTSSTSSTTSTSMYHSSANEWINYGNWIINFSDGSPAKGGKTGDFSIRCVREL